MVPRPHVCSSQMLDTEAHRRARLGYRPSLDRGLRLYSRLSLRLSAGGCWAGLGGGHFVSLTQQWGRSLLSSPEADMWNPPGLRQGFLREAVTGPCPCLLPYPARSQQLAEEDAWVPAPPPLLTLNPETLLQPSSLRNGVAEHSNLREVTRPVKLLGLP